MSRLEEVTDHMYVLAVLAWYLTGFASAAALIHLGHSRTAMWSAAALIGGVLLVLAVIAVVRRPDAVHRHGRIAVVDLTDPARGPGAVGVVALVDDDDGAVADAAARLRQPGEMVVIVRRVGHEASSPWIDTGELHWAHQQLDFAARRVHEPCRTLISSGSLPDVVRDAADGVTPRLLVAFADGRGQYRRRVLQHVAAALGCPLLLVPSRNRHVSTAPGQSVSA